METLISSLIALLRTAFLSRTTLALENAVLRQQLTICQRTQSVLGSAQRTVLLGRSPEALVRLGACFDHRHTRNRARLVRAIVTRVEVDEPNDDVRVYLADLGPVTDPEVPILEAVR